jgi:nicotinamide riboside transporter PnuC
MIAFLPLPDTATTVVSFAATILMMQRKFGNWILWTKLKATLLPQLR